jgi:hypothetical protein
VWNVSGGSEKGGSKKDPKMVGGLLLWQRLSDIWPSIISI